MTDAIAIAPTMAARLQPQLAAYCTATQSTVVPFAGTTADQLRAAVPAHPSSVFLVGALPTVIRSEDRYGHGALRSEPHDPLIWPGVPVGRLDVSGLAGVDEAACYRAYLARFVTSLAEDPTQPLALSLTDGFSQQYPDYTPRALREFSQFPGSLVRKRGSLDNTAGPYGPGAGLGSPSAMFWQAFGGGMDPTWMWNQGRTAEFLAHPVDALYCSVFGSFLGEVQTAGSIMAAVMTWPAVLCCVLNYYIAFPWASFIGGATIGQAAVESGQDLTTLLGSPLVRLRRNVVESIPFLVGFDARIAAVEKDIAALKAAPVVPAPLHDPSTDPFPAPDPSPPPTGSGVAITGATWGTLDGKYTVPVELTGRDGITLTSANLHVPDPAVGSVKQLTVLYKGADGLTRSQVFAQNTLFSQSLLGAAQ